MFHIKLWCCQVMSFYFLLPVFSSTCIIIADLSFGHLFRLSLVANWKFQGTSCLHRSSTASSLWHQRCNCNIAKAKFVLLLHQRWRGSTYNYKWSWDTQSYKKILLFFFFIWNMFLSMFFITFINGFWFSSNHKHISRKFC